MPTTLLAFDTAGEVGSIALVRGVAGAAVLLDEATHCGGSELSGWLVPAILDLLARHGLERPDAVACGIGPGAFTGVRTACATAQGLAFGWQRPLYAVSTLEALLQVSLLATEFELPNGRRAVVMDARQGEAYAAVWDIAEPDAAQAVSAVLVDPPTLVPASAIGGWLVARQIRAAFGTALDAAALGEAARTGIVCLPSASLPSLLRQAAVGVARVAMRSEAEGRTVDPLQLTPHYVRDRVALTEAERRQAFHGLQATREAVA